MTDSSPLPASVRVTFEPTRDSSVSPYRPEDPSEFVDASGARQFNYNNPECAEHVLLLLSSEERENLFEIIFSDPEYFLKLINAARVNDTTLESVLNISSKRRRGQGLTITFKMTDNTWDRAEQVGGSPDIPDAKVYQDFVDYARVCLRYPYPEEGKVVDMALSQEQRKAAMEQINRSNNVISYGTQRTGDAAPSSGRISGPDRTAGMGERARFMARLKGEGTPKEGTRDINDIWNSSDGPKLHAGDMHARIGADLSPAVPIEDVLAASDVRRPNREWEEQGRGAAAAPAPAPTPASTRSPSPAYLHSAEEGSGSRRPGAGPLRRPDEWLVLMKNHTRDEIRELVRGLGAGFPDEFDVYDHVQIPDRDHTFVRSEDGRVISETTSRGRAVRFYGRALVGEHGPISRITLEIKTTFEYC